MAKICKYCNCENPNDFSVCKNCGKLLENNNQEGIRISKKFLVFVFLIIAAIITSVSFKIYDKNAYFVTSLPDKETMMDIVTFKLPQNWVPIGRSFYNANSIPNMYTFFIAAINPKEDIDFQYFSTQCETDNGKEFQEGNQFTTVTPEDYFKNIIKKITPKAENITLVERINPSKKDLIEAAKEKFLFESVYADSNPGTTKGRTWLEKYSVTPVKYIFTFEENGKTYKQLLEGTFVFFVQCFSNKLELDAPIHTAIKFIKCENIYSYKAESQLFDKNMGKYKVFHKNVKINNDWVDYSNVKRRNKLAELSYLTTNSLVGGDKFNVGKFKNTIYYIEYLDKNTKFDIKKSYKKQLRKIEKSL